MRKLIAEPLRDLLGRVGTGGGVEQRKLEHALRRLPYDLEADVPAH
jgi:hypothetical protein